ncbi:hypothetical protein [Peterkaempfera sp. SMS 1(5)a]|uniref:hypothetical protein n=1 Tax=Peterkaempfera podocarpi TaxID=3232308 RepID=UPI00366F14E5
MDPAVLAWLLAQLGTSTNPADLQTRYDRLGSAKAGAVEVLGERRAKLLAERLHLVVNGVVALDQSNNLTGLERQIAALQMATAPDDQSADDTTPELVVAPLRPAHRWLR